MPTFMIVLSLIFFVSCSPQSTSERAGNMFRAPSSEEKGKIPDKFQPIDHKIDTDGQNH